MGNCGGSPKELSLDVYMQKYHPPQKKVNTQNFELNKKVLGGLNGNIFHSTVVDLGLNTEEVKEEQQLKIKIKAELMAEGLRLGNKSSLRVYEVNQNRKNQQNGHANDHHELNGKFENQNPYDVNLLNNKETILYSQTLQKFNFNEFQPYSQRHAVVTKTAIRIYENKEKAISTYGRPLAAIPLAAVSSIQRTSFDTKDDQRLENVDQKTQDLNNNLIEVQLKDDFLPIYLHQGYSRTFRDSSMVMEMSPDKRRGSTMKKLGLGQSPARSSQVSKHSVSQIGSSPRRTLGYSLDMHKKTGQELRESPSKNSKIVMKYINNYQDVGPILPQKAISHNDLVELSKAIDKKEMWVKSDMRLIFAIEDSQLVDEAIEALNNILIA
eukprot:403348860